MNVREGGGQGEREGGEREGREREGGREVERDRNSVILASPNHIATSLC